VESESEGIASSNFQVAVRACHPGKTFRLASDAPVLMLNAAYNL